MATMSVDGKTDELSAADKIIQQLNHDESHKVQLEEVPDEDDLGHGEAPTTSSVLESATGDDAPAAPLWTQPMSAKAAGKQKAREEEPKLELDNERAFPGLGGGAPAPASVPVPSWKKSGSSNGVNGATNGSRPASGTSTPRQQIPLTLPGQESQSVTLSLQDLLPKAQLKKAIPDIIKDLNKKSRAKVAMSGPVGGNITLTASGPSASTCQAALSETANQICSKVVPTSFVFINSTNKTTDKDNCFNPAIRPWYNRRQGRSNYQISTRDDGSTYSDSQGQ